MLKVLGATAVIVSATMTACSSGSGKDNDPDDPYISQPACAEVWIVGRTLPADYAGSCRTTSDGKVTDVAASALIECQDGSTYTTHDDRFFAKLGGLIAAGPHDASGKPSPALSDAYDAFVRACDSR